MVVRSTILIGFLLSGCLVDPEAPTLSKPSVVQNGPAVVFDPLAKPIANIPFPNDLVLKPDPTTASGVSWNVSEIQPTEHQVHLRKRLNTLDGFGPSAPITVGFDQALDLATVTAESVIVINIEPGHPREGEVASIDFGDGFFPFTGQLHAYYGHDPFADVPSLLFPGTNISDADGDGRPEPVAHYIVATNTLILRPITPLAQGARYAVLLTKDIKGSDSNGEQLSIQSPFGHLAHTAQIPDVERALKLAGIERDQLAFGWTYTTANVVRPLQTLRKGLYGEGPLARLASVVEPKITEIRDTSITHDANGVDFPADPRDHRYILQAEFFTSILGIIASIQDDDNFHITFNHVDYLVFGSWHTPNIRTTKERDLSINTHTGDGDVGVEEVPFMIAVPKTTERFTPPFPVMLYFHGTGTSRIEPLAIADSMARQGIAVMAFDQVGHGPVIQDIPRLLEENDDAAELLPALIPVIANLLVPDKVDEFYDLDVLEAIDRIKQVGLFAELAVHGRAEDYNGDGRFDIAESFFHSDPFRLCASFWQDLVDMMQMVKVIRSLDQAKVPSTPLRNPASATYEELQPYLFSGDFNADGILDIGGPSAPLSLAGTSLGGIHAVMGAAIEPEITSVTPIVAGAGLAEIMTRSGLHFILEPLFEGVLGNLVVGCVADERLFLTLGNSADKCRRPREGAIHDVPMMEPGTPVTLTNMKSGESRDTLLNEAGGFAVSVASDPGDPLQVTFAPTGTEKLSYDLVANVEGAGYERNSSEFRRAVAIQQHAFALCDPANFARHLFWEPLPGHPPTNVFFLNAIGDDTVPVASSIVLGLASGIFGKVREEWQPLMSKLIDVGVLENELYDVHDIRGDNPTDMPAIGLFESVESDTGVSSMRLADVNGKHEWIAGYEKDGFQFGKYSQQQISIFHACDGRVILDNPADCLSRDDCELMDTIDTIENCPHIGLD